MRKRNSQREEGCIYNELEREYRCIEIKRCVCICRVSEFIPQGILWRRKKLPGKGNLGNYHLTAYCIYKCIIIALEVFIFYYIRVLKYFLLEYYP